jgi:hypothetical protein
MPIVEPLLDASSTTAWYIVAPTSAVDGVELTFLQGYETPQTHEWVNDATMARNYSIIQCYQAKAVDYRGWVKHDGA